LSGRLGDFWSSAIFLPIWAALYLVLRAVKRRVVEPRVGVFHFSAVRKARLGRFTVIMVAVNVIALVAGILAAFNSGTTWVPPVIFGVIVLLAFSLAAYFLDIPRYFFYGVLLVVAGAVGEVLFQRGLVSHHGYPVVFGFSAALIAAIGLLRFAKHLPPRTSTDAPAAAGRNHD
jgi:TctA family transporter